MNMPSVTFLNGRFVSPDDAAVSAFDAGLQHGVGLFETMLGLAPPGAEPRVLDLVEHLQRLKTSCEQLALVDRLNTDALADAVLAAVAASELPRARVRLTLTGGDLNLRAPDTGREHHPTMLIHVLPATVYPDAMFERGVTVRIADARPSPFDPTAAHKALNYWWRLSELRLAGRAGAAESLVFQVSNHLCGGCVSNALLVKDGVILTPFVRGEEEPGSLPSPVLPGVTRAAALAEAAERGWRVERRALTIHDVLDADEVMLTNSSWGVLPVTSVERRDIGPGTPGPITRELLHWWRTR